MKKSYYNLTIICAILLNFYLLSANASIPINQSINEKVMKKCNEYSESEDERRFCWGVMSKMERNNDPDYREHAWGCFKQHSIPSLFFDCIYSYHGANVSEE